MTGESSNERLRTFVAIQIPGSVRKEMERVQKELRPFAARGDIRWMDPEQLHLTVKFPGTVPASVLGDITKALTVAAASARPFALRARGIGFFPDARAPRVIWAGLEDDTNRRTDLQKRIEKLLAPFTGEPRAEQFRAHATLGRFKKFRLRKTQKLLPHALALALADCIFGEWQVEDIALYRSDLSTEGARHLLSGSCRLARG